jgi:hypothetical protein
MSSKIHNFRIPQIAPHEIVVDYLAPIKKDPEEISAVIHGVFARNLTFTFCPPPLGQPDPDQPQDIRCKTARRRILLPAQKGSSCFYYSAFRVRLRPGKDPKIPVMQKLKAFEAVAEKNCKAREEIEDFLCAIHAFIKSTWPKLKGLRKWHVEDVLKDPSKISNNKIEALLAQFCSQDQHDDLWSFVVDTYSANCIANNDLLSVSQTKTTARDFYHSVLYPIYSTPWEDMPLQQKTWAADTCVRTILIQHYGLKKSSWHPSHPIKSLVDRIDQHGSHIVLGNFGKSYYKNKPSLLSYRINNRCIYGWLKDAERVKRDFTHSVVLVGARTDKKTVYFIDPVDASDPENPEPVYAMSYARLIRSISTLFGIYRINPDGELGITNDCNKEKNEYAVYGQKYLTNL